MFISEELNNHLKTSNTISTESIIIGEINMNDSNNLEKIGNYRYRPGTEGGQFSELPRSYDPIDEGGYYTGATDSNIVVSNLSDNEDRPISFTKNNEKMKLLYSLKDCLLENRPRSGINKLLYLGQRGNQYLDTGDRNFTSQEILSVSNRPRYYMSSRKDLFKYWTSYRNDLENNQEEEFGISRPSSLGNYYIYDAAPFVVYKENVPANRLIFKMQTNVGDVNLGSFIYDGVEIEDPLYGQNNQTTPKRWRIEVLKDTEWVEAASFDENYRDANGNTLIGSDGYVELSYGLRLPVQYENNYIYFGEITDESFLPDQASYGSAYLIKTSEEERGTLKVYDGTNWESVRPEYYWAVSNQNFDVRSHKLTKATNPEYFINGSGETQFREFDLIRGIRIVVESMNREGCTFDLIEMSPRIVFDLSDKVSSFNITKTMSDLGNASVPVGGIFASIGSMDIFDDDFSFNPNNTFDIESKTGSILSSYVDKRIKFNFYKIVRNVKNYDYYIPIKSMYVDSFPNVSKQTGTISFELRDLFFFLESMKAPELLIPDCSISYAVSLLLDYIGYSNYVFKRIDNESEMIIPFFFTGTQKNVAEVLTDIAVASQTAMFFDEYNNLVVMSKEYIMPETESSRETDSILYGQIEEDKLPNIINLSSEDKQVYNDGKIDFTTRYIQREISQYSQARYTDRYKTYGYKPVLLWEISGKENLRTRNARSNTSQGYTLTAAPLNTTLSSDVPLVENNQVINNILDLGENIDFPSASLSSHQGYFYANGEIIKYDAIEYAISGVLGDGLEGNLRWISSNEEYQKYFSKLPFNGKMYPTGNVRIYSEPIYETINGITRPKNGEVKRHGRGQFGTPITEHTAGLSEYWSENTYAAGCLQEAKDYLFTTNRFIEYPTTVQNQVAGKSKEFEEFGVFESDTVAQSSTRNGIIKNFRANKHYTENEVNYFSTAREGTIQSSALVFNGPDLPEQVDPVNFVSYMYKEFNDSFKHFGTRMRIIGSINAGESGLQSPEGSFIFLKNQDINADDPSKNLDIRGGSGGIAININKERNTGYFFEIVALTEGNAQDYINPSKQQLTANEILSSPAPTCNNNVVTITLKNEVDFVVGQTVEITGLVDSLNPTDTRTPLNGEYKVTAINNNKKTIKYTIPGAAIPNRTSTTGGTLRLSNAYPTNIANVYFYKVEADENNNAIPKRLWSGTSQIVVDDGKFTGQNRFITEDVSTVYDLSVEHINSGESRTFFLFINGKQVQTVVDTDPLPEYNSMALFVRGTSRCMFENIYAVGPNVSQNSNVTLAQPLSEVWQDQEVDFPEFFKKYAISGIIQKTYLSGINSEGGPEHSLYYDEFGTIMREAAFLNIKYDRAYPALYSRIMKTFNQIKGYSVSGFYANSYGAEFLIINCTDANLNIDDTTGNFLRIQGVAFTQETSRTLTVDDYYKKISSLSDPIYEDDGTLKNPLIQRDEYNKIINSRYRYGIRDFSLTSPYIQTEESAEKILGWIIEKVSKPKILLGINTFSTFDLQLGDIVKINYKNNDGVDVVCDTDKRFVIYNIENNKSLEEETMTMYLVEV
jgi:hypothetical protein